MALVLVALGLVAWRGVRRWPGQATMAASAFALLTSSLSSHSAALLSGAYLGVVVDWLHFTAVAAWIGGLLSLVFVLPVVIKASQAAGDQVRARAVAKFSQMALVAVGVIILTGTFRAGSRSVPGRFRRHRWPGLSVAEIGLLTLYPRLWRLQSAGGASGAGENAARTPWQARRRWFKRFRTSPCAGDHLAVLVLMVAAVLAVCRPPAKSFAIRRAAISGRPG
jgi:putative copper export protein